MADVYYSETVNNTVHFTNEPKVGWTKYSYPTLTPTMGGNKAIIDLYDDKFILPENARRMFCGATNTTFNDTDKWVLAATTNVSELFRQCPNLVSVDMSTWGMSTVVDASYMFAMCPSLKYVNMKGWQPFLLSNVVGMFFHDELLEEIDVDPNTDWTQWHRLGADQTAYMFSGCVSLPKYTSALEDINTNQSRYINNTTDIGVFKAYPITYHVRWLRWSGPGALPLYEEDVEKGKTPVYVGDTPTKPGIGSYNYIFDHWDPTPAALNDDQDYMPIFRTVSSNTYTITFYDNEMDKVLWTTVVPEGETPVYGGETPTVPDGADPWYNYTFTGWTPSLAPATQDKTYTTVYRKTDAYYTVKWMNWNGSLYYSQTVRAGQAPEYSGTTPTRASDYYCTYTFKYFTDQKGSRAGSSILYDTDYVAQYDETPIIYLRTFDTDGHGYTPSPNRGTYGTVFNRPFPDPFDDGEYVFVDWYADSNRTTLFDFSTPLVERQIVYGKYTTFNQTGAAIYVKENDVWYKVLYPVIKDGGRE